MGCRGVAAELALLPLDSRDCGLLQLLSHPSSDSPSPAWLPGGCAGGAQCHQPILPNQGIPESHNGGDLKNHPTPPSFSPDQAAQWSWFGHGDGRAIPLCPVPATKVMRKPQIHTPPGYFWCQNTQKRVQGLPSVGLEPKLLLPSGVVRTGSIGKVLNYSTLAFPYVNY